MSNPEQDPLFGEETKPEVSILKTENGIDYDTPYSGRFSDDLMKAASRLMTEPTGPVKLTPTAYETEDHDVKPVPDAEDEPLPYIEEVEAEILISKRREDYKAEISKLKRFIESTERAYESQCDEWDRAKNGNNVFFNEEYPSEPDLSDEKNRLEELETLLDDIS